MGMVRWVAWASIAIAVLASPANAGDDAAKTLYMHYCSSCHGESGKGDGTLAGVMQLEPADLTQLAKKAGGELSFMDLLQAIDGRKRVRGHGETGMPVWGEVFRAPKDAPEREQLLGAGKLLLITYYVESLQEK